MANRNFRCPWNCTYFLWARFMSDKRVETRYECLIDGTTPFVEVSENYDIVGRSGDLWILEDKVDE